ncbi:hypothetical protein QYF61_000928 [Mycteria americana]|uniref:Endonuclease/exonuclease/phosphatase domain-containing protein n=1 Tax=Mycteria americana TaxID=33587 RepID=A0AAN7PFK0_MYCAM|nr:hypothetical protein QYF61_000928 [Mycteria americana]
MHLIRSHRLIYVQVPQVVTNLIFPYSGRGFTPLVPNMLSIDSGGKPFLLFFAPLAKFSSSCSLAFLTPSLHNHAASLFSSEDTCPCFHCLCISFLPFSLTSRHAGLLPSFPTFLHLGTESSCALWKASLKICQLCSAPLSLRTVSQGRPDYTARLSHIPQDCELHQCVTTAARAASNLDIAAELTCIGDHQVQYRSPSDCGDQCKTSWQPVPMLDNRLGEEIFPNIQSEPPLVQLKAISSCPMACYLGEETDPHLSTTSFQAVVESNKVSPQTPLLQAKQSLFIPSVAPHKTCAPDPSPASLPFSGHAPATQCPSCTEGPKTEHSIGGGASPVLSTHTNRDKTGLARDNPAGSTPMFAGWCASKVLQTAVSVELGDGEPRGSKDTGVIDVLETMEAPENGDVGIRASPPKKVVGSVAQLKCIYTNARSMGNNQEELEAIGKANKADIMVGICYRPPSQDEEAGEIFYKHLGEVSQSLALVLVGDFNLPGVCWKYNTVERKQSRRLLERVADNFLTQLVSEPTREGAPLDLLFTKREGLVSDVMAGGCLGQSDHEMIEFLIRGEVRRGVSRTATLDFRRADFGLFRRLVDRVPWDTVLKGKGVQEGWAFFKKEILKVQEQTIPMC